MALATLSIDLEARLAGLQTGLDKAARLAERRAAEIETAFGRLKGIGASLGGVIGGAFAVGQITQFVRGTITAIDALNDASDATGSTVEALSALEQVALRNGGTLDDVTGILVKFNSVLKEADGKNGVSQALKAIGLDAAELRKIDPSEALQRTAVALQGFADDGNKARITQELFGKSIREAAPLLKDLAEAGQLNATVTKEQAEQAEKFNKNLSALSANATNVGRAIVGDMLPALNEIFVRFSELQKVFGGVGAGLFAAIGEKQFTNAGEGVEFYTKRIAELNGELEKVKKTGTGVGFIDRQNVAAASKDIEKATKLLEFYQRVAGTTATAEFSNEGRNAVKRLPSALPGGAKPGKFKIGAADLISSTLGGDLEKLLSKERLDDSALISVEAALQPFNDQISRLNDLIKATPTAELERQRSDMQFLAQAFTEGRISVDQFNEAARTRLGTLPEEVKPALNEITEVTKEFQRNVQDLLGDGLESLLKGDFESIGRSFGDMLRKMAAQAIAADIGNLILGKMGQNGVRSGGALDGLFGSLLGLFGFAKGGVFAGGKVTPFASGGVVGSPTLFGMRGGMGLMGESGPEAIIPLKRGSDGKLGVAGGGTTINNYNVAAGVTRHELVSSLQMMANVLRGEMHQTLRRSGVA